MSGPQKPERRSAMWPVVWLTALLVIGASAIIPWVAMAFEREDTEALESPLLLSVARQLESGPQGLYGPYGGRYPLALIHAPLYYRVAALAAWPLDRAGVDAVTAALVAGLGSLLLLPGGGISLGASGAILGLAGILLAPHWRRPAGFPEGLAQRLYDWLARPLLLLFVLGFGLQALDLPIQLDNGAHLGGLLCGLLLGYLLPSYLVRR